MSNQTTQHMRARRDLPVPEEKNYISEDENVQNQAACLNRIFRRVNRDGLTAETLKALGDDIDYVARLYHIDSTSTVLLAAILEKSASNSLMDDEDLAMYLGCTNIEFIRYHEQLRNMDKAGIIQSCGGRNSRRCYRVTPETMGISSR